MDHRPSEPTYKCETDYEQAVLNATKTWFPNDKYKKRSFNNNWGKTKSHEPEYFIDREL